MNKGVRKYYKYNYREYLDFRYRLYQLHKEQNFSERLRIAENLISYASTHGLGIYSCPELELPFLELAKTLPMPNKTEYVSNSFLHVMTQAYLVGGHTRVVERWINTSSDNQRHSIILLNQKNISYPITFEKIVRDHKGKLYILYENDILSRASKLRDIAMQYEYVILHIHMSDPTAIIAFGINDFTRPVILFNHADHNYWCGSSIVDMLADIRDNDFAFKRRGIHKRYTVRIPIEPSSIINNYPKTKEQSRIELGLPLDKKILLTVGGQHKYQPFADCEFCDLVNNAISHFEDVVCYGIGPTPGIGNWDKYGNKFIALGNVDYGEQYFDYLNACDVYINSIPIGGGTAVLDAIQFRKPVLSFSLFRDELGDIIEGVETIYDPVYFTNRLYEILKSKELISQLGIIQNRKVLQNHGTITWHLNIQSMLEYTPKKHAVRCFSPNIRNHIDDMSIMISLWNNTLCKRKWTIYDIFHQLRRIFNL